VSSNVLSLTTLYAPQDFRVTTNPVTTTRPEPPTTGEPAPGPVHLPGDPVGGVPTTRGSEKPNAAASVVAAERSGSRSDATTSTKPGAAHAPGVQPATLQPAGVARSAAGAGAGLGWLGWALVLLLALAALSASGYFWKSRHPDDPMPGPAA
jgi:hypothetical protein